MVSAALGVKSKLLTMNIQGLALPVSAAPTQNPQPITDPPSVLQ